jgi:hypothetical protein
MFRNDSTETEHKGVDWFYLTQEHDNDESRSSVRGGEFLDQLSDFQLLKKNCAQWNYLYL